MKSSAILLFVSCFIISGLWIWGIYSASKSRAWTLKALLLLVVFSGSHSLLAARGILSDFSNLPPPFAFFFSSLIIMSLFIAFSGFGGLLIERYSFAVLIGFQSFRILAELVIFSAHKEGIAPIQMSLEGYNPDIIPAVLAIPVFFLLRRSENRKLIHAWNALGFASLMVITFIAITSMPLPIRLFMSEPSNIWVTTFPYVLLPSILVTAALTGHFLVWRKLANETSKPN